jgi:hypothetical protein
MSEIMFATQGGCCSMLTATQSAEYVHGHVSSATKASKAPPPTVMGMMHLCSSILITKHSQAAVTPVAALVLVSDVLALGRWRLALALQLALAGL